MIREANTRRNTDHGHLSFEQFRANDGIRCEQTMLYRIDRSGWQETQPGARSGASRMSAYGSAPYCYPFNYECWRCWDLVAHKMVISDSANLSSLSISLGLAGVGTPADSFLRVLFGREPALRASRPLIPTDLPLPAPPDPELVPVGVVPAPPCRSQDEGRQEPRIPLNQLVATWLYPIDY